MKQHQHAWFKGVAFPARIESMIVGCPEVFIVSFCFFHNLVYSIYILQGLIVTTKQVVNTVRVPGLPPWVEAVEQAERRAPGGRRDRRVVDELQGSQPLGELGSPPVQERPEMSVQAFVENFDLTVSSRPEGERRHVGDPQRRHHRPREVREELSTLVRDDDFRYAETTHPFPVESVSYFLGFFGFEGASFDIFSERTGHGKSIVVIGVSFESPHKV